ncbi:MAG: amidohydrolase family protein [Ferruginibacter sp.]
MIKIDSHIHFWNYDPVKDAWISDDMKVLQQSFLPQDIQPVLHNNIIDGCIAVQADQSDQETKWLCALARENHFIKGVIGWIDLRADDIETQLQQYKAEPLLKGFRHIVQAERDNDFLLQPAFCRGIEALAAHGYVYEILIYPKQLTAAIEFVQRFPQLKLALDHCGKPDIKNKDYHQWQEQLKTLARNPNLYCKVSGLIAEADWTNWKEEEIYAVLDIVLSCFGIERIFFGSDWPVLLLAGSYEKWLKLLGKYFEPYSLEDKARFWSGNAIEFYGL